MHVSIDATGTREAVQNEVAAQIKRARNDNRQSSAVLAALGDEIQRHVQYAPGEVITVHADLMITVTASSGEMVGVGTEGSGSTIPLNPLYGEPATENERMTDGAFQPVVETTVAAPGTVAKVRRATG